jgi:hypothetical protein
MIRKESAQPRGHGSLSIGSGHAVLEGERQLRAQGARLRVRLVRNPEP